MSSEFAGKQSVPTSAKAYSENDKLGPLAMPTRELAVAPVRDLRGAVIAAFRDAIDRAQDAATDGRDLDAAVHSYRKALRRARAILALVAGTLPDDDASEIREALRRARRAVSAARDHAVAPEALRSLVLDDAPRAAAEGVLAAARTAAPDRAEVTRDLVEGAGRVTATADALAAALPDDLGWPAIVDGVAATYRAARRQLGKAKRSRRALHAWRRRSKELSYQLELIAAGAGDKTQAIASDFDDMSSDLGDVVDLIMLEEFIETHLQSAAVETPVDGASVIGEPGATDPAANPAAAMLDDDAADALTEATETALRDRGRAARRRGKELFARSARRFGRRLAKAVRRDLAPAAASSAPEPSADRSAEPSSVLAGDPAEAGATDGVAQPVIS